MKIYGFTKEGKGIMEMGNSLTEEQGFVGGYIECVCLTDKLVMVLNEDGKILGMEPRALWMDGEDIVDVIVGDFFVCRFDEEGEFSDILDEDIPEIERFLISTKGLEKTDRDIYW